MSHNGAELGVLGLFWLLGFASWLGVLVGCGVASLRGSTVAGIIGLMWYGNSMYLLTRNIGVVVSSTAILALAHQGIAKILMKPKH